MHEQSFWSHILETKGELPPGASLDELTEELLDYLRSPDPLLRDEYGYQILTHWILSGRYDAEQLLAFMERWLEDLESGLGESGTDSVITRSFAALMLSVLVYRDMQEPFFSEEAIDSLVEEAVAYFAAEQDWRGYDGEKGWLHALAHTADLFKFLARNEKSTPEHHMQILDAIAQNLPQRSPVILTHGEDERLAMAAMDVLKRNTLSEPQLRAWVNELIAVKELGEKGGPFQPDVHGAYQNTKRFLRALYFRISYDKDLPDAYNLEYDLYQTLKQFME